SVGVSLGLQDFFNQSRGTTTFSSGAVTGQQSRELLLGTIMGIGRYYPGPTLGRGFYLGMGAGGQFAQQYYQLGVTKPIGRSAFHFAIAPELGVVTPIMEDLDVVFTARFTATTAAGNYLGGGARNFKFITLGVGMAEREPGHTVGESPWRSHPTRRGGRSTGRVRVPTKRRRDIGDRLLRADAVPC